MATREQVVENYLTDLVRERGGECLKWTSPGTSGVPDRIVVMGDRVVFVEVKTMDGVLSHVQKRMHLRLHKAGRAPVTVYGRRDVDTLMSLIDQGTADTELAEMLAALREVERAASK